VKTAKEKLKIGKPLVFDLSEMHSFSEWLRLTNVKPIKRGEDSKIETEVKPSAKNQEKFDIIEQFITSKPKLETNATIENIDVSFIDNFFVNGTANLISKFSKTFISSSEESSVTNLL